VTPRSGRSGLHERQQVSVDRRGLGGRHAVREAFVCRQRPVLRELGGQAPRFASVGSFTVPGKAGANAVRFASRASRHKRLAAGRYRLIATPRDGAGNRGAPRRTGLRIATSAQRRRSERIGNAGGASRRSSIDAQS
jgi:hypothetical protein